VIKPIIVFVALITATGCKTGGSIVNKRSVLSQEGQMITGLPVLVYKTKGDYRNYVPVLLSEDKSKIVTYPDPKDIRSGNRAPSILANGYLLDNRGIGKRVAFLRVTYAVYGQLPEAPTMVELEDMILDKNPLIELYDCGSRNQYKNLEADLNAIIQNGALSTQCKLAGT
jgi:hypothetical protein